MEPKDAIDVQSSNETIGQCVLLDGVLTKLASLAGKRRTRELLVVKPVTEADHEQQPINFIATRDR